MVNIDEEARKKAHALQQAQLEEARAGSKLEKALVRANYHLSEFGSSASLVVDGIDAAEKKDIEPALKAWLAKAEATDKLLSPQDQHSKHGYSQSTMKMVQTYFKKNNITVDDAVLGDEYKQLLAHSAKKAPSGPQK